MGSTKQLVEYIAKALVDAPDDVEVDVQEGAAGDLLSLRVAPDDRGRVIGKNGRTAHAIRTLLTMAAPAGSSPTLEILD